ncbi:MAG: hypothetical protein LBH92_03670 [Bacteroidales bacterium]|jgi:uncharacterized membrane protein YphA (DoxX/SURF4 family)|nr:hypothetical protein [Bacteroidales bacterium]
MEKRNQKALFGWIILTVSIASAVAVYFITGLSWIFLSILIINILAVMLFRKQFSRNALAICRILIGLLFIFSGFVKGVDPMGTIFKMEEYMGAYGTEWAISLAPLAAIVMILLEFSLGCFALFNIKPKLTTIGVGIMMVGFTILTFVDAIANPVSDCGCFGDAVKMSNWQTFYKNLVIDAILLVLILNYGKLKTRNSNILQFSIGGFIVVLFLGMEIHAYYNMPIIDFLPWKVGEKAIQDERLPVQFYYTVENKNTGEKIERLYDKSLMADMVDSTWQANWKMGTRRDVDPNEYKHNLRIVDGYNHDITSSLLEADYPLLIATIYNIDKSHKKALERLKLLQEELQKDDEYYLIMLVAGSSEEAQLFAENYDLNFPVYTADDVEVKMMNRSNPGLLLLKNKIVQDKWDYHHIPDYNLIKKIHTK